MPRKLCPGRAIFVEIMKDDLYWMGIALREAQKAADRGEVPIGAVVVGDGAVLRRGHTTDSTT
jgi:tRNA(Arg) A34 adenosine deaminase TadA